MQTYLEKNNKTHKLRIVGEMTLSHASTLKAALLNALADCYTLEIELTEVTEIDSSGLQLLLLVKREANTAQQQLRLCAPSAVVMELLTFYHLVNIEHSEPTL